ncbi:exodeoxyribonuclease VII small subunit [Burkholderiales bacterium]|jgi:exodeoxyribonuclease VII small subunit
MAAGRWRIRARQGGHRLKYDLLSVQMSRKAASSPAQPASYGEAVQQLEQLIAGLESGQLPLEELLGHYQRGTELLRYCRDRLQAVEDQVRVLDERGDVKPWMPE